MKIENYTPFPLFFFYYQIVPGEILIGTYHTDRTEASSSGFGKSPDSKVRNSKDHHSRLQSLT